MTDGAATFVFADIAGFTALTEAHGDEEAVKLVEELSEGVEAELPAIQGEYVKTIGDALMLRIPAPGDAVLLALRIANDLLSAHGLRPSVSGSTTAPPSSARATTSERASTSPHVSLRWPAAAKFCSRAKRRRLPPT